MGDYGDYKRLKPWNIEIRYFWDPIVWVVEVRWDKADTEPAQAYAVVCINVNVNAGLQGYGKHTIKISLWINSDKLLLHNDKKNFHYVTLLNTFRTCI